jgi:hypothetical protein
MGGIDIADLLAGASMNERTHRTDDVREREAYEGSDRREESRLHAAAAEGPIASTLPQSPFANTSAMQKIREGMVVVDANGKRAGTVEFVLMGDPDAISGRGNELAPPTYLEQIGESITNHEREPVVPDPLRAQLLRSGFIKVDGPGFGATDRYVRSDLIASVSEDTVHLTVARDQLPPADSVRAA